MSLAKLAFATLLAMFLLPVSSQTANFRDRPIKLIVPWAAGGQPDGYTLLLALPETNVLNPMVYKNITYSTKDFESLAYMGQMPFALVSNMTLLR
jgi:tripartite-type tricarboxylate transporter receptor subunit TctC